jgi:hypothetical protein
MYTFGIGDNRGQGFTGYGLNDELIRRDIGSILKSVGVLDRPVAIAVITSQVERWRRVMPVFGAHSLISEQSQARYREIVLSGGSCEIYYVEDADGTAVVRAPVPYEHLLRTLGLSEVQ